LYGQLDTDVVFYSLFRGGLPKIAGSIPAGQRQRFLVDCRNLSDSDATSIENIRKRRRKKRSRHFNSSLPHIRDTQTPTTSAFNATALLHTTN
jgi:hypothetical protein